MAANPQRRAELCDAGLSVIAALGIGGLTHRAVDRQSHLPIGTCSNYFRTRDELLAALGERILVRLAPDEAQLGLLAAQEPSLDLLVSYIDDIYRRTTTNPDLMLALFELRLEATRRPVLADLLTTTLAESFRADVAFNEAAGLPGRELEIALLHYAIEGFVFDQLTTSIGPRYSPQTIVRTIVDRLVGMPSPSPGGAERTD